MHIAIKRICVPTDFSECGDHAVQYGAALARKFGADLHLIHIIHDVTQKLQHPDFTSQGTSVTDFLQAMEKGATQYLANMTADKKWRDLTVHRVYLHGNAAEQITNYAQSQEIDLLVLGTHGHTGLKHFFMGSVAERVARTAPCPVLTVRHPTEREFMHEEETRIPASDSE